MRLSIEHMKIENFKGTRNATIDFSEKTAVSGMNGTGKTTIPDAFSWVLFNKDSAGNAPGSDNFREKPLDADGHEIHNLDTTVELNCTLDGKRFDLKRTQRENWVKKRGYTTPEYKGNVSTYWINDVETKLSDFKSRIAEIAPEEVFRLIGTLAAFNAQDWKKRREQLLALTGGTVDSELLARDEYRKLADECGQRNVSIDELRKILNDQRRLTNNEIAMIPVRIDEARKALPEFGKDEIDTAEYMIQDCQKDVERLDNLIAAEKATAANMKHDAQIAALEQECASLTRQTTSEWAEGKRALDKQAAEASEDFRTAAEQNASVTNRKSLIEGQLKKLEERIQNFRNLYAQALHSVFTWDDSEQKCPTCGQDMPKEKLRELREKAKKNFNHDKQSSLATYKEAGETIAQEIKAAKENLANCETEIAESKARMDVAQRQRDDLSEKIKAYPISPDYSSTPRIEELRSEIAKLREDDARFTPASLNGYEDRKAELLAKIEEKRAILARRDAGKDTEKRIAELESQQKTKGAELAELESLIEAAEQFIKDRCAALEESINSHFPTVRWKLFETQINGGIADACNCMIPCESGLVAYNSANTAARVNADIEIINVLSKHYDVYIPLFVDGAESVNRLAETDSQLITLSVSTDAELTVKEVA